MSRWSQLLTCCALVGLGFGGYLYVKSNSVSQEEQINLDYLKAPTHVVQLGDEVSVTEQGSLESSDNVEISVRSEGKIQLHGLLKAVPTLRKAMLFLL